MVEKRHAKQVLRNEECRVFFETKLFRVEWLKIIHRFRVLCLHMSLQNENPIHKCEDDHTEETSEQNYVFQGLGNQLYIESSAWEKAHPLKQIDPEEHCCDRGPRDQIQRVPIVVASRVHYNNRGNKDQHQQVHVVIVIDEVARFEESDLKNF